MSIESDYPRHKAMWTALLSFVQSGYKLEGEKIH